MVSYKKSGKIELKYECLETEEIQRLLSVINDDEIEALVGICPIKIKRYIYSEDYGYGEYVEAPTHQFDFTITIMSKKNLHEDDDVHEYFKEAKRVQDYIKTKTGIE